MNIITLPFAIVVSVIAATTVFRNVFIAYDNFAGDNVVVANTSGLNGSDVPAFAHGRTDPFQTQHVNANASTVDERDPSGGV